jgi:hypothetical protein
MIAVSTVEKTERTLSNMPRVTDNFDINVYNRGADESTILPPEQAYDEWMLCPYKLEWDGTNYSISDELHELNLVLTEQEVIDLTLGYGDGDLIGNYIADDDFWIDANSFKETYKNIPPRVQAWIDNVFAVL